MLWKESAFYRGKLGATLIFNMLSEHILACMERPFNRGFIFLVFCRWQFEGCTWMRIDSCNCRKRHFIETHPGRSACYSRDFPGNVCIKCCLRLREIRGWTGRGHLQSETAFYRDSSGQISLLFPGFPGKRLYKVRALVVSGSLAVRSCVSPYRIAFFFPCRILLSLSFL